MQVVAPSNRRGAYDPQPTSAEVLEPTFAALHNVNQLTHHRPTTW